MKRSLVLLSVVGLVFAGVANAAVQQGDTELDFLGAFMTQNGVKGGPDIDAFAVSAAVGYFFTDNIQAQAALMGAWVSVDIGNTDVDVDVYGIGIRGKYHFMPTNQWVPYVGGQLLWVSADAGNAGDGDGMLWGPVVGVRYELNANNDIFAEGQYQLYEGDVGDFVDDGFTLMVGLIHQFK